MAVTNNPLVKGMRGAINKQIVFRELFGKTIVSAYPKMNRRKSSPLQLKNESMMASATEYARSVREDEALRNAALVRLNVTRNRLFTSLVSEYFRINKQNESTVSEAAKPQ